MLSEHLVTKRYEWIRQIYYLWYYQWLQFTPLTEGDTSPLIGGSHHTAVFSIRTVVCGTTIQKNAYTSTSSIQLVPSCRARPSNSCWHCSRTRELPLYIINVCGVADPGTWWNIGSTSSCSNISERDDLSSVVNASLVAASRTVCH